MSKTTYIEAFIPIPPSLHEKGTAAEIRANLRTECEFIFEGRELDESRVYKLSMTFTGKWFNSRGKPDAKLPDTLNMAKVAEDEIMRAIGLNDRHNFDYELKKRNGSWGCYVIISALEQTELSGA